MEDPKKAVKIEYVTADVNLGNMDPSFAEYQSIFEKFKVVRYCRRVIHELSIQFNVHCTLAWYEPVTTTLCAAIHTRFIRVVHRSHVVVGPRQA